jgi:hypothetical protein
MGIVNRAMSPGDLDHPRCICGREMRLATVEPTFKDNTTVVHTFECSECQHLLKVMHDQPKAA